MKIYIYIYHFACFFAISSMRAIMTLLHCYRMFHVQWAPYATTCITMQARAMVDKEIYVWLLFVFTSIITYQIFHWVIDLMFSLSNLRSITYTRDTNDKRQLTYFCAHFSLSCRLSCLFSPKFVKMNFPVFLPSVKFHRVTERLRAFMQFSQVSRILTFFSS